MTGIKVGKQNEKLSQSKISGNPSTPSYIMASLIKKEAAINKRKHALMSNIYRNYFKEDV